MLHGAGGNFSKADSPETVILNEVKNLTLREYDNLSPKIVLSTPFPPNLGGIGRKLGEHPQTPGRMCPASLLR